MVKVKVDPKFPGKLCFREYVANKSLTAIVSINSVTCRGDISTYNHSNAAGVT